MAVATEAEQEGTAAARRRYPRVISVPVTEEMFETLQAMQDAARQPTMASFVRGIVADYVDSNR
jgi:hypothetical protein